MDFEEKEINNKVDDDKDGNLSCSIESEETSECRARVTKCTISTVKSKEIKTRRKSTAAMSNALVETVITIRLKRKRNQEILQLTKKSSGKLSSVQCARQTHQFSRKTCCIHHNFLTANIQNIVQMIITSLIDKKMKDL